MGRFRASFLMLITATRVLASGPKDYAGQYVLRLGTRNFLVVNLRQADGALTGTLSRPHHSSLGPFFTNISADVITKPVTTASVEKDHLHFVATNPSDASDSDAFDLTLLTPAQASLQASDIPIRSMEAQPRSGFAGTFSCDGLGFQSSLLSGRNFRDPIRRCRGSWMRIRSRVRV